MAVNTQNWRSANAKSAEEIEQEFDNISDLYDEQLKSMDYRAPKDSVAVLLNYLSDKQTPILDAGCGTGLVGEFLHAEGFTQVTGTDISLKSLEEADKKNVYVNTVKHNLLEPFPFDDNTFGSIICIGVFSRFNEEEILALLQEFERISQTGAIIVISHRQDILEANDFTQKINSIHFPHLRLKAISDPYPYMGEDKNYSDVKVKYIVLNMV